MRKGILVLIVAVYAFPAWGSQPGHPLDCSDWVFSQPGFSCTVFSQQGPIEGGSPWVQRGGNLVVDNEGFPLIVRRLPSGPLRLLRFNGTSEVELARMDTRSVGDAYLDDVRLRSECIQTTGCGTLNDDYTARGDGLWFDAVHGRVLIPMWSGCSDLPAGPPCPSNYGGGLWIASIGGFTPLFEILQTYTPTADTLGFRVPAHPEGLRSADRFDTYWGHVSDLPDFTQARPMQCHYPATPPAAGDFLTVADTSPAPPPGSANYVVTAVTNGTQRRYGRKLLGGVMSGRDPALLPACP